MSAWNDDDERPERPQGFAGDWRGARLTFDDPMSWSLPLPLLRGLTGIEVRVHLFFLVFVLVILGQAASREGGHPLGLQPTALGLLALFVVVLLHEYGHCIACRAKGGTADQILIWPLGGLATCNPPKNPSAHLWTALGGPLANLVIVAVLTPAVGLTTGRWLGFAIPDPRGLGAAVLASDFADWWMLLLFLANFIAWALLLFNLIPMFPLDGGRILQALLWPRAGYARSMKIACRSGLVGAVALGFCALLWDSTMLLAIALFGGFVCYATARSVEAEREFLGYDAEPSELVDIEAEIEATELRAVRMARATAEKRQTEAEAELDRILDKIARSGIESLTSAERATLERATDEKRRREQGG